MKTVTYMGQTFSIPDEAKFIAADESGDVYVYSMQPRYDDGYYWKHKEDCSVEQVGRIADMSLPCEAC